VPVAIELEDGGAARQIDRVSFGCSVEAVCDPHVIGHPPPRRPPRRRSSVRQWLRPCRVDAKHRRLFWNALPVGRRLREGRDGATARHAAPAIALRRTSLECNGKEQAPLMREIDNA